MQWVLQGTAKGKVLPTAFVTFKDTFTSTIAATSMMHHDLRHWTTRQAPSPRVHPVATQHSCPLLLLDALSPLCRSAFSLYVIRVNLPLLHQIAFLFVMLTALLTMLWPRILHVEQHALSVLTVKPTVR